MITKNRVVVSIDKEIEKDVRRILKEQGLKLSTYVNMVLRALVESEKLPMKDVYQNVAKSLTKDKIKKKKV